MDAAITEAELLGSWRLISFESRLSSGEIHRPFGDDADGVLTYSPGSRLSAMVWARSRAPFVTDDQQLGSPEEYTRAMRTVVQYVGTFALRNEDSAVVHRIEQSVFPNLNGVDQLRFVELGADGDRLVLTTPPITYGGESVVSALTWRRLPSD